MLKIIRQLEIPLYLLIIAVMVYETNLGLAIILLVLSVLRLVLNSWGFNSAYKDLEDIQEESKKTKK